MMAVRCVVLDGDKVLLCKSKEHDFYFLPGGSVEHQEALEEAIYREFKEEMDIDRPRIHIKGLVCLMEVMYGKEHGLDPIFEVSVDNAQSIKSAENHLDFVWKTPDQLQDVDLKPSALKAWFKGGRKQNHITHNNLT